MKPEVRILVSACGRSVCAGFIVRGESVDGMVSGSTCSSLCGEVMDKGYWGELRYAVGDCTCGLPVLDRQPSSVDRWLSISHKIVKIIEYNL
ncbi:MAG: hypothetical protein LRS46_01075 [Desulfurococcales archaeon]|nr:hypothetical protein [Desulfurococcales archaeon]